MTEPFAPQHCARCRRPAPDQESDEALEWEALDETGEQIVCPGCLTLSEEQAIAADDLATAKAAIDEVGFSGFAADATGISSDAADFAAKVEEIAEAYVGTVEGARLAEMAAEAREMADRAAANADHWKKM